MKRALILAALAAFPLSVASVAQAGDRFYEAELLGINEFPNPGDPDGKGFAKIRINDDNPAAPFIDWVITVENIAMPISADHIHKAPAGAAGPVTIDFNASLTGAGKVDIDLIAVINDPAGHYVNVHNSAFPGGAVRGQLKEVKPPSCYADCDGDAALTIDDFICFQTVFALGDPYADCDGDTLLTIDDFICFQTAFALGC